MIQRIQSIYLFLASAFCGVFATLPPSKVGMSDLGLASAAYLSIGVGVIALVAIFLFGNRKTQAMLVKFAILVGLAAIVCLFVFYSWPVLIVAFGVWALPIALIFLSLALRGINKDEKLIRSVDRLR